MLSKKYFQGGARVTLVQDREPARNLDSKTRLPGFVRFCDRARPLAGTILQSDETSVRVGKRTWRTWVFHYAEDACLVIHRRVHTTTSAVSAPFVARSNALLPSKPFPRHEGIRRRC